MSTKSAEETYFEDGKSSAMDFMQCLEDIIHYIDGFTCCHEISLDTSSAPTPENQNRSLSEVFKESQRWSHNTETLHFSIERRRHSSTPDKEKAKSILIRAVLSPISKSGLKIQTCWLDFGNQSMKEAKNRGELRDLICAYLVPVMRLFPIVHFLCMKRAGGRGIEPVPFPPPLFDKTAMQGAETAPELCMLFSNENASDKRKVFISVDANDQMVTWEKKKDEESNFNLKNWTLEQEEYGRKRDDDYSETFFFEDLLSEKDNGEHTPVFRGQTLLFLNYILGASP